jgi:hypothetical protein
MDTSDKSSLPENRKAMMYMASSPDAGLGCRVMYIIALTSNFRIADDSRVIDTLGSVEEHPQYSRHIDALFAEVL